MWILNPCGRWLFTPFRTRGPPYFLLVLFLWFCCQFHSFLRFCLLFRFITVFVYREAASISANLSGNDGDTAMKTLSDSSVSLSVLTRDNHTLSPDRRRMKLAPEASDASPRGVDARVPEVFALGHLYWVPSHFCQRASQVDTKGDRRSHLCVYSDSRAAIIRWWDNPAHDPLIICHW